MHDKTVYAKSSKGREEIATRAHKLGFKQRALLIMVDGASNVETLSDKAKHLGDVGVFLSELRDAGFIEPVEAPTPEARAPGPEEFRPEPAADLNAAKTVAVRFLEKTLGPDAVDLCVRIEDSQTVDAFLAHAATCRDVLKRIAGGKAANEFWKLVGDGLGKKE